MYLVVVGSHYAAKTCGDPPAFSLPCAGITGMGHYTWAWPTQPTLGVGLAQHMELLA